jgi:hypothetical protein
MRCTRSEAELITPPAGAAPMRAAMPVALQSAPHSRQQSAVTVTVTATATCHMPHATCHIGVPRATPDDDAASSPQPAASSQQCSSSQQVSRLTSHPGAPVNQFHCLHTSQHERHQMASASDIASLLTTRVEIIRFLGALSQGRS